MCFKHLYSCVFLHNVLAFLSSLSPSSFLHFRFVIHFSSWFFFLHLFHVFKPSPLFWVLFHDAMTNLSLPPPSFSPSSLSPYPLPSRVHNYPLFLTAISSHRCFFLTCFYNIFILLTRSVAFWSQSLFISSPSRLFIPHYLYYLLFHVLCSLCCLPRLPFSFISYQFFFFFFFQSTSV